jgi:hypothetical protein
MKGLWELTNMAEGKLTPAKATINAGMFNLSCNDHCKIQYHSERNIYILIDGYVLPRFEFFDEYCSYKQDDLVFHLYLKYGLEFINRLKGSFNIIIIDQKVIHIFNDHHSFKKFFIYQRGKDIFVSNQLNSIASNINLKIDKEHIALFCLMQHFVEGCTMFEDIIFSKPATHVRIIKDDNLLKIENYLDADHFLTLKKNDMHLGQFATIWSTIIAQYVKYLKPKDISMTLTGGNDSRMILSALMKNKINVNLFSFGDPKSFDAVIANEISNIAHLPYSNYFVEQADNLWQLKYSEKIISFGNSLINIHRAHRLDAIEREIEKHPNVEMIFGGFMGGDYVKGLKYEDYITSRLVREFEFNSHKKPKEIIVEELLKHNEILTNKINLSRLNVILNDFPYFKEKDRAHREFFILYKMIGSAHDMQDTNVFASKVPYVINPFMDIDFMEAFFPSQYSPMIKKEGFINNKLRLNRSKFHLSITHKLAPEFSVVYYSKGGYYNISEYFGNKFVLVLKRFYRYKFKKHNYAQNFPINNWMNEYCKEQLNLISPPISEIFDIKRLQNQLTDDENKPTLEGFWHKYTNPINIDINFTYFNSLKK